MIANTSQIQKVKRGGHSGLTDYVLCLNPGGVIGLNVGMDVRNKS